MYFYLTSIVLLFAFFVIFFKPEYRRVEAERKADLEASMFVPTNRDRYSPLHKRQEDDDDDDTLLDEKETDKS